MESILQKLNELNISHETHHHNAVMTCEEQVRLQPSHQQPSPKPSPKKPIPIPIPAHTQAAALKDQPNITITKNLFLKDKRRRLFIITAMKDTNIDLQNLSMRMGLGKGGLRLAPDPLIASVLSVPPGSVTPLALSNPTASKVELLLDHKLQLVPKFCVHPLENTATTLISAHGLEIFLKSLGREKIHWIDLAAKVAVTRENPGDLKELADGVEPSAPEGEDITNNSQGGNGNGSTAAAVAKPEVKKSNKGGATAAAAAAKSGSKGGDATSVSLIASNILTRMKESGIVISSSGNVDNETLRRLTADVELELNVLKNAAYANGFKAAKLQAAVAVENYSCPL
jgi:hypothetical protein